MSRYDDWLLEGSEGEPWNEESAPHGLCEFCETPLDEHGACECNPRTDPDDLVPRASFDVDTTTGTVSEVA